MCVRTRETKVNEIATLPSRSSRLKGHKSKYCSRRKPVMDTKNRVIEMSQFRPVRERVSPIWSSVLSLRTSNITNEEKH